MHRLLCFNSIATIEIQISFILGHGFISYYIIFMFKSEAKSFTNRGGGGGRGRGEGRGGGGRGRGEACTFIYTESSPRSDEP